MTDFYDEKKPSQSGSQAERRADTEDSGGIFIPDLDCEEDSRRAARFGGKSEDGDGEGRAAIPGRTAGEGKLERVTVERLFGEKSGEGGTVTGKKRTGGVFSEVFDCFETFCYALVLMMLLFVFVFRFVSVNGSSMIHTLHDKDKLIISDVLYKPSTGDIVVLDAHGLFGDDRYIIKRVIATGGQKVEINFADWTVKVDGNVLEEKYVRKSSESMNTQTWISNDPRVARKYGESGSCLTASFVVPAGKLFVMGDNRNGSSDSREKGFFDEDSILGRVLLRIAPKSRFGRVG